MFIIAIVLSFIIGSLPFSFWIGKLIYGVDLRTMGSGNPGATNLLRNVGRVPGIIGLILDTLKGGLPVIFLPPIFCPQEINSLTLTDCSLFVGVSAILGHIFSPFLKFKGGKGVSTSLGVFLALVPKSMGLVLLISLPLILLTRIMSFGVIIGTILFPVFTILFYPEEGLLQITSILLALIIIIRHKNNIVRLIRGKELKL